MWSSCVTQSHDLTQLSVADGKKSETHAMWNHKGNVMNGSNSSMLRSQTEAGWLPSQNRFLDATDESKSVTNWHPLPKYSATSTFNSDTMMDSAEKVKKTETPSSYRLFGIDIFNHSSNSLPMEKTAVPPVSIPSNAIDWEQKSDVIKACGEKEQDLVETKENQNKNTTSASARSRTKVLRGLSSYSFFFLIKLTKTKMTK